MKTVIEYLKELPEPERTNAIRNANDSECNGQANEPTDALSWAIIGGFRWSDTPQGWAYWNGIHEREATWEGIL